MGTAERNATNSLDMRSRVLASDMCFPGTVSAVQLGITWVWRRVGGRGGGGGLAARHGMTAAYVVGGKVRAM